MQERDLRKSLRTIGPQFPGLEYAGELVDGRRRVRLCDELQITLEIKRAESLQAACSALYVHHPARAIALARGGGAETLLELADLCGVTPVSVAGHLHAARPRRSHKRRFAEQPIRTLTNKPMVNVLVMMEPELRAYAREVAKLRGHGVVNKVIRDALWRVVALEMPQAPLLPPRRVLPAHRPPRKTG